MKLLTTANTKTMKGEPFGYRSFIMHLAPAMSSGYNVCAFASRGCAAACLNTAGRGVYPRIQAARRAKTIMFKEHPQKFMNMLVKDIRAAVRNATRNNLLPCIRLNGTSDVLWERIPVEVDNTRYVNIMSVFPDVQFYDYTKVPHRYNMPVNRYIMPDNYHLTFSLSESNNWAAQSAIENGMNVAVVFRHNLPHTFLGLPVVPGDVTDLRFLDPKGAIVGLTAKGKAKKDRSGFVMD